MTGIKPSAFTALSSVLLGLAVALVVSLLAAQLGYVAPDELLAAFEDPNVRKAVLLTFSCATLASVLALLVSVPAAYVLARSRFRGVVVVDTLLDIPVLLSPVALGLSLVLVLRSPLGQWVESHLIRFLFAVPGIVLAQFVLALALQVRVLKSGFEDVDPLLEHVARTHGLGPWAVFRRITLPLVRPALIAAFVLGWCRAAGDFGATVMVAGAIPGRTETIPVAIYLSLSAVRLERAVALALLLSLLAVASLVVVRLVTRRSN